MSKKYRLILKWLLLITWMAVIFGLSAQDGTTSGDLSFTVLGYLINLNILPASVIETLSFLIRKAAHMSEYALLAILIFSLVKEYQSSLQRMLNISFISAVAYACTDEFHQLFVAGRAGQIADVLIDSLGALIGLIVCYLVYRWRNKA